MTELKCQIQEALTSFGSGNPAVGAANLLKTLGYESDRTVQLSPNTYRGFTELFHSGPSNFDQEKAKVKDWQTVDIIFQLTEDDIKKSHSLFEAKQYSDKILESYLFFALALTGDKYTRGDLVKITREINKLTPMPAMILFRYNNYLTVSVIDRRLHKRESTKDVLEKVTLIKDINISKPHRAHIEILHDLSFDELKRKTGFSNFVELHNAWKKALDTKELNKKFYDNLFYWYLWAVKNVRFPQIRPKEDLIADKVHQSESVIRLLTRLLFCWFMKEKQELIPEILFDKREIQNILTDFSIDNKKSSVYYRAILQNLFFATLSVPIKSRKYIPESFQGKNRYYGNQYVYRYQSEFVNAKENLKLFKDIPFLNGGLFECLDDVPENDSETEIRLDGFSSKEKKQAFVPDFLFWYEHKGIDLSGEDELDNPRKKNETVYGIIDILNSYKFTIEENTPLEEEIALDPELLGKVFESLLAYYNPETKANARKQTGSFYTPREIVNYMVDESLIAYLASKLPSPPAGEASQNIPSPLAGEGKGEGDNEARLRRLIAYSDEPHKFTPGEVNVLIDSLENLKVLDPACGSGAFPMGILHKLVWVLQKVDPENKRWFESIIRRLPDYAQSEMRKKLEGENWDYLRKLGVIQQSIYGVDIQPIAIQIAKLRFFISLLVDQDIKGKVDDNFGLMPLPNLDFKLVSANSLIGAPEQNQQSDGTLLFGQDEFFAAFNELTGQYFGTYEPADKKKLTKKIEKLVSGKVQDKIKEIQSLGTHTDERFSKHLTEKNKAIIEQKKNDARLWESYNNLFKHESVGFFETKYFFPEVKEGFDVVIGNPPYINVSNLKPDSYRNYLRTIYRSAKNKTDTYAFFLEEGFNLLSLKGYLSYIIPQTWKATASFSKLREIIFKEKSLVKVIDLDFGTFDAIVKPMVVLISNEIQKYGKVDIHNKEFMKVGEIPLREILEEPSLSINTNSNQQEKAVFKKIEDSSVPLEAILMFSRGIKTSDDKRFISQQRKNNEYKRVYRGKNIKAFQLNWDGEYIWYRPDLMKEKVGSVSYTKDFFEVPEKLVIQRVNSSMQLLCAYDDGQNYFLDTTNVSRYREWDKKISLKYLCALLNSTVINYWYCNKYLMPTIGIYELHTIPIKIAKNQLYFVELVDQILAAKKKDPSADTSALEKQIDEMVYKLYGLTPEEIAIVEGKG